MYAKETLNTHYKFLKREKERQQKHLIELESLVRDIKIEIKTIDTNLEDVSKALEKLGE